MVTLSPTLPSEHCLKSFHFRFLDESNNKIRVAGVMNKEMITFSIGGPSDRWFAIGFGNEMVGSDAVIYTSGLYDNETLGIHDYKLNARR